MKPAPFTTGKEYEHKSVFPFKFIFQESYSMEMEITAAPEQTAYDKYKNAFMGMSLESALSLIKDKNGDVNLVLPVNGKFSDPRFNLVDVLRAAIVNSITRAINPVFHDSLP